MNARKVISRLACAWLLTTLAVACSPAPALENGERQQLSVLDAVAKGDPSQVRAALEAGGDANPSRNGRSPLTLAILSIEGREFACNFEVLKILLEFGADPNRADPLVETYPLEDAIGIGAVDCAELLRARGADPKIKDGGLAVLVSAVKGANLKKDMSLIQRALSWGIDVNVRSDKTGFTALHQSAWLNDAEVAAELIALGASPCVRDRNGMSPLDLANAVHASGDLRDVLEAAACKESVPAGATQSVPSGVPKPLPRQPDVRSGSQLERSVARSQSGEREAVPACVEHGQSLTALVEGQTDTLVQCAWREGTVSVRAVMRGGLDEGSSGPRADVEKPELSVAVEVLRNLRGQ